MRPKILIGILSGILLLVPVIYYGGREYLRAREAERKVERARLLEELQVLAQEKRTLERELERHRTELQHQDASPGDADPPCRQPEAPCLDMPPPATSP